MTSSTGSKPELCRVPASWQPKEGATPPAVVATATVNGAQADARPLAPGIWLLEAPGSGGITLNLTSNASVHFAGGGEQFIRLDLAGRELDGWIADAAATCSYFHAPVIHASDGWTLIVDTTQRYRLDLGSADPEVVSLQLPEGPLRAFVVEGPPRRGVEVLWELTGLPPLPPAWAFGVWHNCRSGSAAVLEQARRLESERIPASAVWIEDHWAPETNDGDGWPGNYPQGDYPDMPALVAQLHGLGLRALTYVNPMLYRDTPACDDAIARGLVVTRDDGSPWWLHFFHPEHGHVGMVDFVEEIAVPVDFTNPGAVVWWQEKVRALLELGWDGWMEDFGEQVPAEARLHDGSRGAAAHNRYPLLYHGATAAVREEVKPDAVVFARSGYLGSQQHANVYWGGDQLCSWDETTGMPSVIAAGLSAALSGVATWGLDISGIVSPEDVPIEEAAGDRELWLRWCQLGALTPVMRTHLGFKPEPTPPVDIWHDAELTTAFRRWATLHLRLFPNLYSAAAAASRGEGMAVMRPLLLEFPDDEQCWTIHHQFLLGDSLMVAPVLERGARSRLVYIPPGRWYEWGSMRAHQGPAWIEAEADLDTIPLFQREGSVVAMLADPSPLSLNDARLGRGEYDLELQVCPDGDSELSLHDGTTVSLHDGELWVRSPQERTVLVRCGGAPAGIARGAELDFDLRPLRILAGHLRETGEPLRADMSLVHAAREAERQQGLHHGEEIDPEPARPDTDITVSVRTAADLSLRSLAVLWRADGGDPCGDGAHQAPMHAADGAIWRGAIPGQPDETVVRYAFRGTTTSGDEVWVEDAGPALESPDITVPFVRPAERRFSYAVTSHTVPEWFRDSVTYHVLVDRFHPGGSAQLPHDDAVGFLQHAGGTLRGVTEHLEHISSLGAGCILLSPITPGQMHLPYDVTDLCAVDPRLGTLDDARQLCREAHALGIRVILDTEQSFLGYRHPWFEDARRNPESEHRDHFRWHEWPHRPYAWFGGRMLVMLDHAQPAVRRALLDSARFWLDIGFDGFRLDSAGAAPLDFWTEFGATVRAANPDAVTLAEVFGTPETLGHWRGRVDGALDFTIPWALRQAFGSLDGSLSALATAVQTMNALAASEFVAPSFIENHDVPRFSSLGDGDPQRLRQALTVLLTLPQPPVLYYGTEVGRAQGPTQEMDPDARLPMLWGDDQDAGLRSFVTSLIERRNGSAALRRGDFDLLAADDDVLIYRRTAGEESVRVAVNRSPATRTVTAGGERLRLAGLSAEITGA